MTTTGSALVYTVPFLQYITRINLFFGPQGRSSGKLSIDDRSGDFVEYSGPLDINLRTFFHFRKPLPPRIDPCAHKKAIPPQPQPVNAGVISWIWGATLTGAQLDALSTSLSFLLFNNLLITTCSWRSIESSPSKSPSGPSQTSHLMGKAGRRTGKATSAPIQYIAESNSC